MAKKPTRYEIAKTLAGGEIPNWKFQRQLENLTNIMVDIHENRPLMTVNDILLMLVSLQDR